MVMSANLHTKFSRPEAQVYESHGSTWVTISNEDGDGAVTVFASLEGLRRLANNILAQVGELEKSES